MNLNKKYSVSKGQNDVESVTGKSKIKLLKGLNKGERVTKDQCE